MTEDDNGKELQDDEVDIELYEIVGLDNAKKLATLEIYTAKDLNEIEDIQEDRLKSVGFTRAKISNFRNDIENYEKIARKEKATIGTMFLGPQGENSDILERLIKDVLRDHIYWRRNFHPEDRFVIQQQDRSTEEFNKNLTPFFQNLYDLLRRLKRNNVPFSSPRYIAHIHNDPSLTGIVGYFGAMLYNPNNVTSESSPETTDLEIEFGKELATMLGYKIYEFETYRSEKEPTTLLDYEKDHAWGHICSGGTVANLEALWVARNLKYLPLAIRIALEGEDVLHEIKTKDRRLSDMTAWELLNQTPSEVMDLHQNVLRTAKDKKTTIERKIRLNSLSSLGMQRFIIKAQEIFKDSTKEANPIKPGVIIVPSTAHYSLSKVAEILGLGKGDEQLIRIPVKSNFRMDEDLLKIALQYFLDNKIPVIAVVSICGTTEEAAIDPIHKIEEFREEFMNNGLSFYHHCDAAYGGFLRCLFRDKDNKPISEPKRLKGRVPKSNPCEWPSKEIIRAIRAISQTDSVTIDPHKLEYIPYPAGAVVFKDGRMKWEIAFNPAYLGLPFIGSYSVEGSKPGAAAAACWLSMKVFPLNEAGHGALIARTIKNTYTLLAFLDDRDETEAIKKDQEEDLFKNVFNDKLKKELEKIGLKGELRLKVLNYPPDINMLCFLLNWIPDKIEAKAEEVTGLLRMNCFAEAVYNHLKFDKKRPLGEHNFIISNTSFKYDEYGTIEALFMPNDYKARPHSMQKHLKDMGIKPDYFKSNKQKFTQQDLNCCDDEIFVFRCTIFTPWLAVRPNKEHKERRGKMGLYYMVRFCEELKDAIKKALQDDESYKKIVNEKIEKHKSYWQIKREEDC